MDISAVDPSLRPALRRAPKLNLENRLVRTLIAALSPRFPGKRIDGVDRRLVRDGDRRLRVYTPEKPSGAALLWIHGGGLVLGAAVMDDRFCGETARDTGITVVSVDYRLAPKHPFPAAIDDCHAGWRWLQDHLVDLGVDSRRVAIGGQSAGGGLAANLVHRVHDAENEGGQEGGGEIAAQWLFCPMLDDRVAADRSLDAVDHFVWNNRANLVGWSSYLGRCRGAARELPPYGAAARRAELTGLPPTWIYTSDIELFHDEDTAYARRLEQAGVDVSFVEVTRAPHGFEAWAPDSELATDLVAGARDWLRERLGS